MMIGDLVETVRQMPHEVFVDIAVGLPVVLVVVLVLLMIVERMRWR
jgi:hypothetical protein